MNKPTNTRNQSSVFADASQSKLMMDQQKVRNVRNANLLISDVHVKQEAHNQQVLEAIHERSEYNKVLKQMEGEDRDTNKTKRLNKLERQRQLRECYENQIKDRESVKVKERCADETLAQEYKQHILVHDKRRQAFYPKAIHARPGVPAPTGGRKDNYEKENHSGLTGLDVGMIKDIPRNERHTIASNYHQVLDAQVAQRKEALAAKKQREAQATQDAIDMQMNLQVDFQNQRKVIDKDRKVLYDSYLRGQIEQKRQCGQDNLQVNDHLLGEICAPPTDADIAKSMPCRAEKKFLGGKVKESLKWGGNLNKESITRDLGSRDTYNQIKQKYGNHASTFNILTGR